MFLSGLPIDTVLPQLSADFAHHHAVVLHAPAGAGKSTIVPLALLREPWARNRRIALLEPRRLAARTIARRMATLLREEVGQTIGYRTRLDTRISSGTRIEVITEGVLTRMLQHDPALDRFAAVVFDEFHERSLQADLGLALLLDAREALDTDLRVLIMSATLDVEPLARLLGNAPIIRADGRVHPVTCRFVGQGAPRLPHTGPGTSATPEAPVARLALIALEETAGDVLVFLPGAAEIRRTRTLLERGPLPADVQLHTLYGDLDTGQQEAAIAPAPAGLRKIVLATNIAETSLTIEGVTAVVDSGLVRRSVFDPATGMSRLQTFRISRAAAEQRLGRAGRVAPGVCFRAWSEAAHAALPPSAPPEIAEADLAPLALELAHAGIVEPQTLKWLDPPPDAMLSSARSLLHRLGAIDARYRITEHGRELAAVPLHPRLAHMLLAARRLGVARLGARLAALLSERDPLRGRDADIRSRLEMSDHVSSADGSDRRAIERIVRVARELERSIGVRREDGPIDGSMTGVLLANAFPDRIGRRRTDTPGGNGATYTLTSGRGARLGPGQALARETFIVAVELDDRDRDARIRLAAPISRTDLDAHFGDRFERQQLVEWNRREQAVTARATTRLDAAVIDQKPLPEVPAESALAAMLDGVVELGLQVLPWNDAARELRARIELARLLEPSHGWPAVDDAALTATMRGWLAPWLAGVTRREHLARLDMTEVLRSLLTHDQRRQLERIAPTHLTVPSGSRVPIRYRDDNSPVVSVRLQEVFGLTDTPRIGEGQVPVTFELLSPARRPVQITRDLASFWRSAYHDVRRDLRGRYPKHHWPEDPVTAAPARGVRRRQS